jgi:DNA-binding CsgD family transcriptional regulator
MPLYGREHELLVLDELIDGVGDRGAALVVRGEPGIGKSALLRAASDRAVANGMTSLRATGIQSETALAFAGLHQLLLPVIDGIEDLPGPQRDAVLSAFGMADAAAPDLFLTALATLELLADVASATPLLLIVEDAHWLDRPTGDVLAFVARRIELEPIAMLFAIREGFDSPMIDTGLPELRVEPLDEVDAATLIDARAPDLSPTARHRLLLEAEGNPLALVELPRAIGPSGDDAGLPEVLPLTARLEGAFAARAADLAVPAGTAVLVAAVDDGDDLGEILAAAGRATGTDVSATSLEPAVDARLIEIEGAKVRFHHPLVRSAVASAASAADRRAAHDALADAIVADSDRSTWHRAAATLAPDEGVASDLERAAMQAKHRGGLAVAVSALTRAAELSEDADARRRRLIVGAQMAFELGRPELVGRLIAEAETLNLGPAERAQLMWMREMHEEDPSGGATRVRALVEISERTGTDGDPQLAMHFLRAAALRCLWADPGTEARFLVVDAVERAADDPNDPEVLAILAWAAPVERGPAVVARIAALDPYADRDPAASRLVGTAATSLGAYDLAPPYLAASVDGLRSEGRLGLLAQALVSQAFAGIYSGNWDTALPAAEEAGRLARETAQPRWLAGALAAEATLTGLRGNDAAATDLASQAERAIGPHGNNYILALLQFARGTAALGAGRFDDACSQLRRMFDPTDAAFHPYIRCWAVAELAEAAARVDEHEQARRHLEGFTDGPDDSWSPILEAGLAVARPMLADDDRAEALFQQGLSRDLAPWPFVRARLLMAYGEWLRRQRRVAESRAPLRAARQGFDALGATPWGERAREELRASGEASDRREPYAWDLLSPQELRIAQLAAEGLSNREIGQRLYLSHRTIGSHLHRLFPKLGITSRQQLASALRRSTGDKQDAVI